MNFSEHNNNNNINNNRLKKSNSWYSITPKGAYLPIERHGHSLCAYNNKLYLFGGTPDGSSRLDDTDIFDFFTNCWSKPRLSGVPPSGRYRHSAVVIESKMFVFGGYRSKCLGDLHVLDLETHTWSEPPTSGVTPTPRSSHSACVWGKRMVIFGGSGHKYSNELHILDTQDMTWHREESAGYVPSERWCHTAAIFGDRMFVFGGTNARRQDSHVYMLDLPSLYWTRLITEGCLPPPRQLHTAAAIGPYMVIFGGWVPHTELNDMYVLNTRTMTWQRISPEFSGAPSSRQLHAACTVNGGMVIFGGYARNRRMNDLHMFFVEHQVPSLQDLCVEALVVHLPRALPHLHFLPEELLFSIFRKMGHLGKFSREDFATILGHVSHLTELSLIACSDRVDDAWIDSIADAGANHDELLKLDLSYCRRISDKGLQMLSKCKGLRVIVVDSQSEVTRTGLECLKRMLPAVTVVQMVSTGGEIMYNEFVR